MHIAVESLHPWVPERSGAKETPADTRPDPRYGSRVTPAGGGERITENRMPVPRQTRFNDGPAAHKPQTEKSVWLLRDVWTLKISDCG